MARFKIEGTAVGRRPNRSVVVLRGASISVLDASAETATLYSAETGAATLLNPFQIDSPNGEYEFWVDLDQDYYDIFTTFNGQTKDRRIEVDPSALAISQTATARDEAERARTEAVAAASRAEVAGADIVARPLTKATAIAAFETYRQGDIIEVQDDESQGGGPYRYEVALSLPLLPLYAPANSAQVAAVDAKASQTKSNLPVFVEGTDTAAIMSAITQAETESRPLVFPRNSYQFDQPLTITGIDVDFGNSELEYTGDPGSFALTLNSITGAGTSQRAGQTFKNLNVIQENWAEYQTFAGSKTYDPPQLASYSNITNISQDFNSTTVNVPGARAGGYVRVTFSALVDGVTVCGRVTADDTVTVYFNNYVSAAIDMPSGTLSVTVVNNAFHGICLGGNLGLLDNFKVNGFTGISLAMGSGICQITGVDMPAALQSYYWRVNGNITPAAGWGLITRPRNNENLFNVSFFPMNAYGDAVPRRANTISQAVISGVTNAFEKLSLEGVSSEPALIFTHASNQTKSPNPVYYESNTDFAAPPSPFVLAETYSSANEMEFRMFGPIGKIRDRGVANKLSVPASFYINGQASFRAEGGENIVYNGDFINEQDGWSDFSSGASVVSFPGDGYFSGKRARVSVTNGRVNLQQAVDQVASLLQSGLQGETLAFGAWIKTNLNDIVLRANGNPSNVVPSDEEWYYASLILRQDSATDLDLSIIDNKTVNQTGYVEIANVTGGLGTRAPGIAAPTPLKFVEVNYNPPSLAAGAQHIEAFAVADVDFTTPVRSVVFARNLLGVHLHGYVSSVGNLAAVFTNNTAGTVDLGAANLTFLFDKV